jgi:quercetin dioxygenase-like cupin family protein
VPTHAHANDLVVYVLQGALRAHLDREDVTVREGDVLIVPAGMPHQTESLDDTFVMTFSSTR